MHSQSVIEVGRKKEYIKRLKSRIERESKSWYSKWSASTRAKFTVKQIIDFLREIFKRIICLVRGLCR